MRAFKRVLFGVVSAVSILGTATGACAESNGSPSIVATDNFSGHNVAAEQNRWVAQPARRSFQWDEKGHWGLKLDMNQPVGRDMQLGDVQAGAYYRVTPSLRVGGAVALGDSTTQQPADRPALPLNEAPRVRLETSFKF